MALFTLVIVYFIVIYIFLKTVLKSRLCILKSLYTVTGKLYCRQKWLSTKILKIINLVNLENAIAEQRSCKILVVL